MILKNKFIIYNMKSLKYFIQESLKMKNNKQPKNLDELKSIVVKRFKELGPGTKNEPIDFNDIDVSRITTFYDKSNNEGIFERIEFEYIDISDWNVSKVEDMQYMFAYCEKLKSVGDISNWDVSNVKNMIGMFYHCSTLKYVGDLSNWNVSNVKTMQHVFSSCEKLKSVGDISNWDVSHVEYMNNMFFCSGITNTPDWYKE